MNAITPTPSEPIPDLQCGNCNKEYKYDLIMGWGCIVLVDERNIPHTIVGGWCDEACLNEWLDTKEAKDFLAPGL